MKRHFLLFFFLLCIVRGATCQGGNDAKIDSLIQKLNGLNEDTTRVNLLNKISNLYPYTNPDAGIKYGQEALQLAEKLSWTRGTADANATIGGNYANKADYASALEYEYKALKLYEQLHDLRRQATLLRNIGIVHHRNKNQEKALEYDLNSLQLYEQLNDKEGIAAIYNNMANVYYTLRDKDKVLENNFKALKIFEEIKNNQGTARILGNIANFYAEEGDFSKAMPYYFDALRREKAMGNLNGVTRNMGNIGETYFDIATSDETVKPDSLIPAGKQANLQKAMYYLKATIVSSRELKQADYELAFAEVLSDAYKLAGNEPEALKVYKEFIILRDSIYDVEKYNAATRLEMNYEYGKREDSIRYDKQLTEVKLTAEKKLRNREKLFFISGLLLVLLFAAFISNRYRLIRIQKKIIEKEKKRSDDLLLNILPAETAEELKNTGTTKAKDFDEVTVLFTDFINFTTMSEQLSAQELVDEINYCYSAFDNIIHQHGIEKIKTIGDSYMCAGGLPVESKTNAVDTVRVALQIRDFILNEKEKRIADGKPYFEIRIGCNTGPVVAGIVGIKKFAYDIWGDTVNIASRMESACEAGKVNISGTTYELVKDQFTCTHRGKIDAKNKGMIDMYFVEGQPILYRQ